MGQQKPTCIPKTFTEKRARHRQQNSEICLKMHHFLHILKDLYWQSWKKYIRTTWLQKELKKTTNLQKCRLCKT